LVLLVFGMLRIEQIGPKAGVRLTEFHRLAILGRLLIASIRRMAYPQNRV
jgi:hypothetical protein